LLLQERTRGLPSQTKVRMQAVKIPFADIAMLSHAS